MIVLRALGALLSYPREDLRQALPEIAEAIHTSPLVATRERDGLVILISELTSGDILAAEERYVELFDRVRATSLDLFEHRHGEGRGRGDAMVGLKRRYERAGFELATRELPDHLPVVLEYLSCRDVAGTRDTLRDCAHLVKRIGEALIARALLCSRPAGVARGCQRDALDQHRVPRAVDRDGNSDGDWF